MARKTNAETAGAQYATDQLASEYFAAWVRDQMLEASQADPSEMLPLETKSDALVIAKNMLKQLAWDTQREHRESKEFYEGFRKTLDGSRDWLADELLQIKGEMGGAREMRASGGSGKKHVADMTETELVATIRDCERRLKDPGNTEALRQSLLYRLENCRAELVVRGRGSREMRSPKAKRSVVAGFGNPATEDSCAL